MHPQTFFFSVLSRAILLEILLEVPLEDSLGGFVRRLSWSFVGRFSWKFPWRFSPKDPLKIHLKILPSTFQFPLLRTPKNFGRRENSFYPSHPTVVINFYFLSLWLITPHYDFYVFILHLFMWPSLWLVWRFVLVRVHSGISSTP